MKASGEFSPSAIESALARMRRSAQKAHRDAQSYTGPLSVQASMRTQLFAEAAADLAGTSVQAELDRAAGLEPEPAWKLH